MRLTKNVAITNKKYEYPYNLIAETYGDPDNFEEEYEKCLQELKEKFGDHLNVLESRVGVLFYECNVSLRDQGVILSRYRDHKSLSDTGKLHGISRGRVAQICRKFQRKLRMNSRAHLFLDTKEQYEEYKMKQLKMFMAVTRQKQKDVVPEPTDSEEASALIIDVFCNEALIRNALARENINTLDDLVDYGMSKTYQIRNIGAKSIKTIIDTLERYGYDTQRYIES